MPETLPPVDPNVRVPDRVRAAADAAAAIHAQAYAAETPPQPDAPAPQPVAEPAPQPAPAAPQPVAAEPSPQPAAPPLPQPAPQPQPDQNIDWEHRYHSMEGRYRQAQTTMGQMQEQLSQMGEELVRMTSLLNGRPAAQPQPPQPPQPAFTPQDRETYGDDLLSTVQRVAEATVAPKLSALETENQQLKQVVSRTQAVTLNAAMDRDIPNWRQILASDRFKAWARLPDVMSGAVRGRLLNDAFRAGQPPRAAAIIRAFLNEEVVTGQQPAPQPLSGQPAPAAAPRTAAVDLASLAAPGAAKPAAGTPQPASADKPFITLADIKHFYSPQGRAAYVGRDDDRRRDEEMIFAAQREGRVRGTRG